MSLINKLPSFYSNGITKSIQDSFNIETDSVNSTVEKTLEQWLEDSNIRLVEDPIVTFSDREKEEFYQEWKRNEKRFYSQINVRFTLELDK